MTENRAFLPGAPIDSGLLFRFKTLEHRAHIHRSPLFDRECLKVQHASAVIDEIQWSGPGRSAKLSGNARPVLARADKQRGDRRQRSVRKDL